MALPSKINLCWLSIRRHCLRIYHQEYLVKMKGLQKHRYQKLKFEAQAHRLA